MSNQEAWLAFLSAAIQLIAVVAWPIVALIGILALRAPLDQLVARMRSFAYGNHKAEFNASQQGLGSGGLLNGPLEEGQATDRSGSQVQRLNPLRSPLIAQLEEQFAAELAGQPVEQANQILLTALAKERLEKVFSLAYADIFGSQILALQELIDRGGFGTWEVAHNGWQSLQGQNSNFAEWDIHRYLEFLKQFRFIETDEKGVRITDYGRAFLSFLNEHGFSRNRPN
jgi:hypothetical protein